MFDVKPTRKGNIRMNKSAAMTLGLSLVVAFVVIGGGIWGIVQGVKNHAPLVEAPKKCLLSDKEVQVETTLLCDYKKHTAYIVDYAAGDTLLAIRHHDVDYLCRPVMYAPGECR